MPVYFLIHVRYDRVHIAHEVGQFLALHLQSEPIAFSLGSELTVVKHDACDVTDGRAKCRDHEDQPFHVSELIGQLAGDVQKTFTEVMQEVQGMDQSTFNVVSKRRHLTF